MASVKPVKLVVTSREGAEKALIIAFLLVAKSERLLAQMGRIKAEKDAVDKQLAAVDDALEKWARKDCVNWAGKTLSLVNGKISFQTSPGRVSLVKSIAKTWEDVVIILAKSRRTLYTQFLRYQNPKLDKELVTAEFKDGRITNEELATVGLVVEKEEICIIEVAK